MHKVPTLILGLLLLPFFAFAANEVSISDQFFFDLLKSDNAAPSTVGTGATGQVTQFVAETNYLDITLDSGSAVDFAAITGSTFLKITKISGSNSYSVTPSCPTTTASLSGTGATVVLRLETTAVDTCVVPPTPTSTPPTPTGGAGGIPQYIPPTPTVTEQPTAPVQAVFNFYAEQSGTTILLGWTNPSTLGFAGVRVVRSTTFFPQGPFDGTLVYAGTGTGDIDLNLPNNRTYYYAAFAFDTNGNYATGALAEVYLAGPATPGVTPTIPSVIVPVIPATSTHFALNLAGDAQADAPIALVVIRPARDLSLSVEAPNAADVGVKNMIVRIRDEQRPERTYVYTLSPDSNGQTFSGTMPGFARSGSYTFSVTAYNEKNEPVAVRSGVLQTEGLSREAGAVMLVGGGVPVWWFFFWRKAAEEEAEEIIEEIAEEVLKK